MDMKTEQVNPTRLLPKTGQPLSYTDGDDGYYHAGWWKGLTYDANKTRFVAKTIDGDDVVIDNATGLMWAAKGDEAGCGNGAFAVWGTHFDYIAALNAGAGFAGFKDWRIPNIMELQSILIRDLALYTAAKPLIQDPPFILTARAYYLSSTTMVDSSTWFYSVSFSIGTITSYSKVAGSVYLRLVRGGV